MLKLMAVGAQDNIDRELVLKYANLKVDNSESARLVDSQTMLVAMTNYANIQRDMMDMTRKLKEICSDATSKSIHYTRINFNPPRRR